MAPFFIFILMRKDAVSQAVLGHNHEALKTNFPASLADDAWLCFG